MCLRFFSFLRKKKLERLAKLEIEKFQQKNLQNAGNASYLALAMFDWVELFWNGKKEKFLIRNIDATRLVVYGKYPNIMLKFAQDLKEKGLNIEETEADTFDWEAYRKEEAELYEKIAQESMITPSFQETYDAILTLRKEKHIESPINTIQDVFPCDFLADLFAYHLRNWELSVKKKLNASILKELDE